MIPDVTPTEFGQYLRRVRLDANVTQQKVAKVCGFTNHMTIHDWEKGVTAPSPRHFKSLASLYNVPYDTLKLLLIGAKVHHTKETYLGKFKELE